MKLLGDSARTMGPKSGDPSKTSLCPIMPQEHKLGPATQREIPKGLVWVNSNEVESSPNGIGSRSASLPELRFNKPRVCDSHR